MIRTRLVPPLLLLLLAPLLLADDCSAEQDVNDAVKEQTGGQLDLTSPLAGLGAGVEGNKDAADAVAATRGFFRADHAQLGDQAAARGDFELAAQEYAKALKYTSTFDTGPQADQRQKLLEAEARTLQQAESINAALPGDDNARKAAKESVDAGIYWERSVHGQPDAASRGAAYNGAAASYYYGGATNRACATVMAGLKADIDPASRQNLQTLLVTMRVFGAKC